MYELGGSDVEMMWEEDDGMNLKILNQERVFFVDIEG